jgi:hypothetical protein
MSTESSSDSTERVTTLPPDPDRKSVTIFGAGVAGLTAAQELAERQFDVTVIDPAINEEIHALTLDRGIGGMARSQWGCRLPRELLSTADKAHVAFLTRPRTPPSGKPPIAEELADGKEFLLDDVLVFNDQLMGTPPIAKPVDERRAKDIFDRAGKLIERLNKLSLPPHVIEIVVVIDDISKVPRTELVEYTKKELKARAPNSHTFIDHIPVTECKGREIQARGGRPRPRETWLFFRLPDLEIYPAEHGFRFFPSFYRHLFDSLGRVPIELARPHERTLRTIRDNLIPSEGLGFARQGSKKSFFIPRRPLRSFEEALQYLRLVLRELEYDLEDVTRYSAKLLKYITSSTARRRAQYEHMSWSKFVESDKFSVVSRRHLEFGPQMSAALRGSLSDARTQGNITLQLLMDQIKTGQPDCLLNGPTSGAWLDHWHNYLIDQRVCFKRGKLDGFVEVDGRVFPLLEGDNSKPIESDYYVFALSLPAAWEMAEKMRSLIPALRKSDNDFTRIRHFGGENLPKDLQEASPVGPLQHLSGIQFYFPNRIDFWRGHTQYLDSEWGLTSIAQPQFWGRARNRATPYVGILSVDIGIWDREYASPDGTFKKQAWDCSVSEIAKYAWEQIYDHHDDAYRERFGNNHPLPLPGAYKLDTNLAKLLTERGMGSRSFEDKTPFLVNFTSAYPTRPGKLIDDYREARRKEPPTSKEQSLYDVYDFGGGHYVWAGTFMKTYTRLTSMEGANESARLAVNAILLHSKTATELCRIWDPEDNEIEDFAWLRDLDAKRFEDRSPHAMDTLSDATCGLSLL